MIDDVTEPPAPPVSARSVPTNASDMTLTPEPRSHLIANFTVVIVSLAGLAMLATYLLVGAP